MMIVPAALATMASLIFSAFIFGSNAMLKSGPFEGGVMLVIAWLGTAALWWIAI